MKLSELLKIEKGITSVIGGGGKTTLLHVLADELKEKGSVVITTTTHIMKSEVFHNVVTKGECDLSFLNEQISLHNCICLGSEFFIDKLSPPDILLPDLCSICDYVLVEADGSKHLPLKAHLDTEPIIPEKNNKTILVLGVDSVGKRVKDVVHRYEKFCEIVSCDENDIVNLDMISALLEVESLHDTVVINKCDTDELKALANELNSKIKNQCIISSLLKGEWNVSSN